MRGGKRFCRIEEFFDDSMLTSKLVFGTISERSENGRAKKNVERLAKAKKAGGKKRRASRRTARKYKPNTVDKA